MPDLNPEQLAREKIDAMLVAAGWIVQGYRLPLKRRVRRSRRDESYDWVMKSVGDQDCGMSNGKTCSSGECLQ